MRKIRTKHFIILLVLLIAIVGVAIFLYLKFYGKNIFESKLSEILGRPIRFEKFTLDLEKYTVRFEDFMVPNRRNFKGKNLFDAAKVTVILNKDKFNQDKEIVFDHIIIEKGILYIERNKGGVINLAMRETRKEGWQGIAYAKEPPATPFYNFAKNVKKLTIKDSTIEFKDYAIFDIPFGFTFDDFNADIVSREAQPGGSMPIECKASFTIPGSQYVSGQTSLKARVEAYQYLTDIYITANTQNIDLMQFYPYLEKYTPFSIRSGVFRSDTSFKLENNRITSLSTMVFHDLNLSIDPGSAKGEFLHTSVNKVAPYLTSRTGDLIFDFVVTGSLDNPQVRLGPHVQQAIGMAVMQEFSSVLQGIQGAM